MEQTHKLKPLMAAYVAVVEAVTGATDAKEVDELKLKGVRSMQELKRQLNRAEAEFPQLCREKRSELVLAHYRQISSPTKNSVARLDEMIEVVKEVEAKTESKTQQKSKKVVKRAKK